MGCVIPLPTDENIAEALQNARRDRAERPAFRPILETRDLEDGFFVDIYEDGFELHDGEHLSTETELRFARSNIGLLGEQVDSLTQNMMTLQQAMLKLAQAGQPLPLSDKAKTELVGTDGRKLDGKPKLVTH